MTPEEMPDLSNIEYEEARELIHKVRNKNTPRLLKDLEILNDLQWHRALDELEYRYEVNGFVGNSVELVKIAIDPDGYTHTVIARGCLQMWANGWLMIDGNLYQERSFDMIRIED